MHPPVMRFVWSALSQEEVEGQLVIEAGAVNINGSVRGYVDSLKPSQYIGTDMVSGIGVDLVCRAEDLPDTLSEQAGVVVCTEMLEHAKDWRAAMSGLIRILKPGGVLILTTRSEGFPYHGFPDDYWRFSVEAMGSILASAGLTLVSLKSDMPLTPGVFAKAIKPADWEWNGIPVTWKTVGVTSITDPHIPCEIIFKYDCGIPSLPGEPFSLFKNDPLGGRTLVELARPG